MNAPVLLCAAAIVAAGCASAGRHSATTPRPRRGCELRSTDSVFLADGPVYRGCAVDVQVKNLTRGTGPLTAPPGPTRDGCNFVELAFAVDTTGVPDTRTAHVVSTSDRGYADAVLSTLPTWKYEPARIGHSAVRQIVTDREMISAKVQRLNGGNAPPSTLPTC
jgi:hypothetical protein